MNIDLYVGHTSVDKIKFWDLGGPVMYIFGSLFILLGIVLLFLHPKARRRAEEYREKQMLEYKIINPKGTNKYSETGMYLPAWERVKQFAPGFFALVFFIIGIAFLLGTPLKLFST